MAERAVLRAARGNDVGVSFEDFMEANAGRVFSEEIARGAAALVGVDGVRQFVAQTLADSCRGLTSRGADRGSLRVRVNPSAISVVCGALGAVCKVGADGAAACDDP